MVDVSFDSKTTIKYFMEDFMEKAVYRRQANDQIAVVNVDAIIKEILESYQSETVGTLAAKIGVSVGTIKTWRRTGRARQKGANALIAAYPIATAEVSTNPGPNQTVTLGGLFDQAFQVLSEIRGRLGV